MVSSEGLSLLVCYFFPIGELAGYIWKDGMRASHCCSQVLDFSRPVAMADAIHG